MTRSLSFAPFWGPKVRTRLLCCSASVSRPMIGLYDSFRCLREALSNNAADENAAASLLNQLMLKDEVDLKRKDMLHKERLRTVHGGW